MRRRYELEWSEDEAEVEGKLRKVWCSAAGSANPRHPGRC